MKINFLNKFQRDYEYHGNFINDTPDFKSYKPKDIEKPKSIEYSAGNYYHYESFIHCELIPSITGYFDAQMEKGFETTDTIFFGYKSYSLIFSFLFWYVEIQLNLLTNKWEK